MFVKRMKSGLTIAEILVVVAVLAILASGLFFVSSYVNTQAKVRQTEDAIELIVTALSEYYDFSGEFPTDCNDFTQANLEAVIGGNISGGAFDIKFSGSSGLYHFLNKVPASRKVISKIATSLITHFDENNPPDELLVDYGSGNDEPLLRFVDGWGNSLWYTYDVSWNFPVVESAGPDEVFDTADDITSR